MVEVSAGPGADGAEPAASQTGSDWRGSGPGGTGRPQSCWSAFWLFSHVERSEAPAPWLRSGLQFQTLLSCCPGCRLRHSDGWCEDAVNSGSVKLGKELRCRVQAEAKLCVLKCSDEIKNQLMCSKCCSKTCLYLWALMLPSPRATCTNTPLHDHSCSFFFSAWMTHQTKDQILHPAD